MNLAGDGNGHIEYRRQYISTLITRRPRITQRQVYEHLKQRSTDLQTGHIFINPDTGAPYSLGTINNDIQQIRHGWHERAISEYGELVAQTLAEIDEVSEEAWKAKDWDLVLKCNDRKRKLLGLDKPVTQQMDVTSGGEPIRVIGGVNLDDV